MRRLAVECAPCGWKEPIELDRRGALGVDRAGLDLQAAALQELKAVVLTYVDRFIG